MSTQDIALGHTDQAHRVYLTPEQRRRHMLIVGASGSGKSRLLQHMLRQDIRNPRRPGLLLIDPHGTLYDDIVAYCAYVGIDRNIHLINPSIEGWAPAFNPLQPQSGSDSTVRVSSMVDACSQVWGGEDSMSTPMIRETLSAVFFALIDNGCTLLEAKQLMALRDPDGVRRLLTSGLSNPAFQEQWERFNTMADTKTMHREFVTQMASSNRRIMEFVASPVIRNIIGQTRTSLDFYKCMEDGDIVLVNLRPSDHLLHDNARLLGALMLKAVFLDAFRRDERRAQRQPFYVYLDEAYQFLSSDIEHMLDQTRKFGVHLILSLQRIGQMKDAGESIHNGVMVGAQTKVVFGGLGPDAEEMAEHIYMGELDLERGVEATRNPTVVGTEVVWLDNESASQSTTIGEGETTTVGSSYSSSRSESSSESETDGYSETDSAGYSVSVATDSEGFEVSAEGESDGSSSSETHSSTRSHTSSFSESESSSESVATTKSHAHTAGRTKGRSQTLRSIFENRYSAVWGLDKLKYAAATFLQHLPQRCAVVWSSGQHTINIRVPFVADVPNQEASLLPDLFTQESIEASPYVVEVAVVERAIERRQAQLIAKAGFPRQEPEPDDFRS